MVSCPPLLSIHKKTLKPLILEQQLNTPLSFVDAAFFLKSRTFFCGPFMTKYNIIAMCVLVHTRRRMIEARNEIILCNRLLMQWWYSVKQNITSVVSGRNLLNTVSVYLWVKMGSTFSKYHTLVYVGIHYLLI